MRAFIFSIFFFPILAFSGNLDRIKRALEKGDYERAYELIVKASSKEPENPGVHFFAAQLYFTKDYARYSLDTARIAINMALTYYDRASEETVTDLDEDGVTLEGAKKLSEQIRDKLFENLQISLTVTNTERFMRDYPMSPYHELLTFQRDSLVFSKVKLETSPEAYEEFLINYPNSSFADPATVRLDELNYEKLKETGKLTDYNQFLKIHPRTRFRREVELFILVNSTPDHDPGKYLSFMRSAETGDLKKRAGDVLYYMAEDSFSHPVEDSIQEIRAARDVLLIPTVEQGKFGFHNLDGKIQIPHTFEDVNYTLKCEVTSDEWIFVSTQNSGQIVNKQGTVLVDDLDGYVDLGSGVAKVKIGDDWHLYHKSGFKIIEDRLEDAEVLADRWIKAKRNGQWGLISFLGYQIADFVYQGIDIEGVFWVFQKDDLLALTKEELIVQAINDNGLDLEFKFEDLELLGDKVIGFRDARECMLDEDLNFLIPWGIYEINPDESGWYLKTDQGYRLYNNERQDIMDEVHPYLETNYGWLALKTVEDWMLLSRVKNVLPSRGYDSLKLISNFCAYTVQDGTASLVFSNGERFNLDDDQVVRTFTNHENFLLVEKDREKIILGSTGEELITGNFKEISFFNDTLLQVELKGKNGLLKLDGSYLIEADYDVISEKDGLVLCLEKGKIGCLDLETSNWISTEYEARIERIGANYKVKREGKYGVINALEEPILSYAYDEIKFWNDTSFLAREGTLWSFVNYSEEKQGETLEFMTEIVSGEENIWKFVSEGKYGLLSNKDGVLLRPEFTDIFNIGVTDNPIFFADQHLDKAGFHVVSYVNKKGRLILSKAYRKEEFEKILCDD